MNKINLESNLLTEKRKNGVILYFTTSVIVTLALWAYEWGFLALICHCIAVQVAIDIYKAEVFYNTKNGNKEFIKRWLRFLFFMSGIASIILLILESPYSAIAIYSAVFWQSMELVKYINYDHKINGNLTNEPGIFEKHYHIKIILIPLGVILYGMLAYQFFNVFNPFK